MVLGVLTCDVLLGDVRSLKQKRSVVRPLVAQLRRQFEVAAAETGNANLHRRTELAVAVVSSTHAHATEVLARCERFVAELPEIELLATTSTVFDAEDLDSMRSY
jgi:uncharacterized protein YlxP (DUF503 family)